MDRISAVRPTPRTGSGNHAELLVVVGRAYHDVSVAIRTGRWYSIVCGRPYAYDIVCELGRGLRFRHGHKGQSIRFCGKTDSLWGGSIYSGRSSAFDSVSDCLG